MSYPTSHMAYLDCYEVMDRALANDRGVRLQMADKTAAEYQRTRINYARKINRRQNEKIYDPEHPLHGASPYDKLVCRIKQYNGACYLYVEHYTPQYKAIEDLSMDEPIEETPVPVPVIRTPTPAPLPKLATIIKPLIKRRI